ncbi:cytochrome c oxidase subunit 2 [Natronorubrum sediminis]|uniref:Cytochrome c oxidase subunit 2 n=1 Tax=Natronorubrum sediminis TaxID=640943 RepID=A0A1H6FVR0_9EURY|nr:cytochrome c oxidase subunit II [Natronorubrum sediminis]SEH14879.1 cytochrome c oxidase subunit 2 [Natronorubrum sediminis]
MEVQTRVDVFESIFQVFLALGTLVGVIVIAYTMYNAYKYRDTDDAEADDSVPTLGELPTGGKGGKKLFLSFGISAIIVISLVVWTYAMLLYVENPEDDFDEDPIEIDVEGENFAWYFEYENGVEATNTMNVPADHPVAIEVTGGDVWHSFGVTDLRVKADAIPGEYDETWFIAEEAGEDHEIECFELCGDQHSDMVGTVQVMEEDEFDDWLDDQLNVEITLEDEDEEPVEEGTYEITLEHQEEDFVYDEDDGEYDNGTITFEDIEQGGEYELTIEFEDDEYETIEDSFNLNGPENISETLEDPDAEDDEEDDEEDDDDEEEADDDEDGGES